MEIIQRDFLVYPIGEDRTAYYVGMQDSPYHARIIFPDKDRCFAIMCAPSQNYIHPPLFHIIYTRDTNSISNRFMRDFVEHYISSEIFRRKAFEYPSPASFFDDLTPEEHATRIKELRARVIAANDSDYYSTLDARLFAGDAEAAEVAAAVHTSRAGRTPNPGYGYKYESDLYDDSDDSKARWSGAAEAFDVAHAYRAYREGTGSYADVRAALRAARGHGRRR
jgi:hypothetical protein